MASLAISLALLLCVCTACLCGPMTPLVAWSNRDALSYVKGSKWIDVGDILDQLDTREAKVLVVFQTKELSFADLMKYGGSYGGENTAFVNLKHLLASSISSVWGGTSGNPANELIQKLSANLNLSPQSYADVDVKVSGASQLLLVVDLPDSNGGEDQLKEQDATIGRVIEELKEHSYIAFYTVGVEEQVPVPQKIHSKRNVVKRASDDTYSLQSSQDCPHGAAVLNKTNGTDPCFLICFTKPINLAYDKMEPCEVKVVGLKDYICESKSNESSVTFETKANCSVDLNEFTMRFPKVGKGGSFYTIEIDVMVDNEERYLMRAHESVNLYTNITVPENSSYSCASKSFYNFTENGTVYNTDTNLTLQLTGIQVQPYSVKSTVFATSYNCEGYFSAPGWMGIFTIIILLIILYVSLVFMFSIKAIDRFDDPKGETISVENLH